MGLESLGGANLTPEIKNLTSNIGAGNNIESAESDSSLFDKTEMKSVNPTDYNGAGSNHLMDYRKYCDACRNVGQEPVSRREFEEANGRELNATTPEVDNSRKEVNPNKAENPKEVSAKEVPSDDDQEEIPGEEDENVGFEMDLDG